MIDSPCNANASLPVEAPRPCPTHLVAAALELKHLSHQVQNKGSTARDHLANERTFLAWLRTSIALIVLGLAFARFAPGPGGGAVVAIVLLASGIALLLYSGQRYFEVTKGLQSDAFPINTGGVVWVIIGLIVIVIVCIVAVFVPSQF